MRRLVSLMLGGATILSPTAFAASIGSESSIGLAADANSNPYLLTSDAKAAESAAFLLNVPITYNGDENTIDLTPRVRLAETHGDEQLLSNYQYLDADWHFSGDLTTLNASAGWHHDSTLYNVFEDGALKGRTIDRQEDIASLGWQRQLTERSDLQLTGSYDRIHYDAAAEQTLASYDYWQGSIEYDHQLSERWQGSLIGGYGTFELIESNYRSQQEFAQVALSRQLSDRWSLKAQLGYSWVQDRLVQPELYCPVSLIFCYFGIYPYEIVQVTSHSSGNSPNGQVTLERRYQRTTVDVSASRAIEPSGLGALVAQTDLSTTLSYQLSERWQLSARIHGAALANTTSNPVSESEIGNRRYADLDLAGNWQWSEHWALQLMAGVLDEDVNRRYAHSFIFSVGAYRQFGRVRLR
jgi:hypothetical protein